METRTKKQIKKEAREEIREIRKRNKKKKSKKGIIILIISIVMVLFLGSLFLLKPNKIQKVKSKKEKTEKKEKVKTTSFTMAMVGDTVLHGSVYRDAYQNGVYDFKPMISLVKEITQNYDVAYYNQETVLGGKELGLSDYPTFNSPQEAGDAMLDAGFNLVSLATNHTMDSGEKAILKANEYWASKQDVLSVGSYSSLEEKQQVKIALKNDISYTMLNYTYGTNGLNVPYGKDYLVNVWPTDLSINDPARDTEYQNYKQQVKSDIDAVRDKVDLLIVAMHWGVEYTFEPTAYEKDMAEYLSSLGVDIIIGTHPHVIQPITYVNDTLVFYSLGNFISAQYQDQNYNKMVEMLGSLRVTKTVKDGKKEIKIDNVKADLLFNYYNAATWKGFKVIPFSNPEIKNYLPTYQTVYNDYKAIVQKYNQDIEVVECAN